jgi:hypothetical protein
MDFVPCQYLHSSRYDARFRYGQMSKTGYRVFGRNALKLGCRAVRVRLSVPRMQCLPLVYVQIYPYN